MTDTLTLTGGDDVAILTIRRPQRRNALDEPLWQALEERARELAATPPRAVIITGAGGHFCSGLDLSFDNPMLLRFASAVAQKDAEALEAFIVGLKRVLSAFTEIPCPVIAAIEGACIGGGMELALHCDLRVAARDAFFSLPEARAGMMPDLGGTVRTSRLIGCARATELILTGRRLPAEEAASWGLVNRVSAPGEALAAAEALALELRQSGPEAARNALRVLRLAGGLDDGAASSLETRAAVELLLAGECVEGTTAFREKRPPSWVAAKA